MDMHFCHGLIGKDDTSLIAFEWPFRDNDQLIPEESFLLVPVQMRLVLSHAYSSGLVCFLEVLSSCIEDLLGMGAVEAI